MNEKQKQSIKIEEKRVEKLRKDMEAAKQKYKELKRETRRVEENLTRSRAQINEVSNEKVTSGLSHPPLLPFCRPQP